jgi:CRISPR-associated exonuclease Cas4
MRFAKTATPTLVELVEIVKNFIEEEFTLLFEVPVKSRSLGVWGKVDAVAITKSEAIPIEIKLTTSPEKLKRFAIHHVVQIVAYALAVEETFRLPVRRVLVVSVEGNTVFQFTVNPSFREYVYRLSRELRRVVEDEKIPSPTPSRRRCRACFYRKFCSRL